jgi:superfamily I DNA and/or RNA helicase/very-short-patch-repair endonuclease
MNEVLAKYKDRLINISSRNRSLVMKKLYKKNSFDLHRISKFNEGIDTKIVEFLLNRSTEKIRLLPDQFQYVEQLITQYKTELDTSYWEDRSRLENAVLDSEMLKEKEKAIKEKFDSELSEKIEKAKKQSEEIPEVFNSLSYLNREITAIEKETGRYELYVGYPFVEGCFKDGTFVNAPLILFPVRIIKEGDTWLLDNIEEQYMLINKVFLMAFEKYNNTTLRAMETEFYDLKEKQLDTIVGLLKHMADIGISIKDGLGDKVEGFFEHVGDVSSKYKPGELTLRKYLILGRFPIANNSIYNDYVELEKEMVQSSLLDKLLINSDTQRTKKGKEKKSTIGIKEEDFYFMTTMDYSQEEAVKSVNESEQLVIYGPPGTGKSQTIANIISDGLAKGKKILMVSQKRAALDVIYNRISELNSKVVIIHDAEKDKKAFYQKAAAILEVISTNDNADIENKIKEKSLRIDRDLECLDKLGEVLTRQLDFGPSLQQMYVKSKKITSKDEPRYEDFRTFREKKPFKTSKYQELDEAVAASFATDLAEVYYSYRSCIGKNEIILKLREDIDNFDIEEVSDKIQVIFDEFDCSVSLNLKDSVRLNKLLDSFVENQGTVEEVQIVDLADSINREDNNELLEKLNNGPWWNPIYWINYGKNKRQEEVNRQEFEKRGAAIRQELLALSSAINAFTEKFNFLKLVLKEEEVGSFYRLIYTKVCVKEYLKTVKDALEQYEAFGNMKAKLSRISGEQAAAMQYAFDNSKDELHYKNLLSLLPEFSVLLKISEIEKENKVELEQYKNFALIKDEINNLMKEKQVLIPQLIISKWDNKLCKTIEVNLAKEKELKRQANKKRQLWPLRKYIAEFRDILTDLFPCWLLSPETVSEIMPLAKGLFDLIIFDEASQMFVESAIPAIYRSNTIVVAGDDKQLKPTSMFMVRIQDEEEVENIETAAALEEESLLDLSKVNYDYVHLNYHYRSKYDELINFSNYAFYDGRLEVSPNLIKSESAKEKPIERILVQGTWIDRRNKEEAVKVVELVDNILRNRKENETVGIITFNINQKDLIDDLLEEKTRKDDVFKTLYNAEISRQEGNEDISLFVKNIENVQGDERDIIIFSTAYARNEKGKVSVNFGSLSSEGGENRLNVAVSRARKKIYVVTSIEPEELEVEGVKNNGPKLFKNYLQYVREVSEGNKNAAQTLLYGLSNLETSTKKIDNEKGQLAEQIYTKLKELGYEVDTQVGVSGYRLDLAIYDKEEGRYVLGIECDESAFEGSDRSRERDIHRQRYLQSRGWKIIRIWSRDWWNDWNTEINRIKENLK